MTLRAGIIQRAAWALMLVIATAGGARAASYAYLPNSTGNQATVVDLGTNTIVAQPDLGGTSQNGATVLPNGNFAYITRNSANQVKVIDTATQSVVATIGGFVTPRSVVASPDSSRVYVGNQSANRIDVIDTSTNAITATIPLGGGAVAAGMALSPDGSRLYAADNGGDTIKVISTATNTVTNSIGTAATSSLTAVVVSPDGAKVYVASNTFNRVEVLDTTSLTLGSTIATGNSPRGLAISPDGTKLYVSQFGANSVGVIDLGTNTIAATIAVGSQPSGIALNAAGTRAYVPNNASSSLSVIDTASNTVIATVASVTAPSAFTSFLSPDLSLLTVGTTNGRVTTGTAAGPQLTCDSTCRRNYAASATVTLSASPDQGQAFFNWSGDCSGTSPTTTVSMASARSCNANFMAIPPVPPAWFNQNVLALHLDTTVGLDGQFVSASVAAAFQNPSALAFNATLANGDPLPAGITFNTATLAFSGISALPNRPVQPVTSSDRVAADAAPNLVYPATALIDSLPVVVTARDTLGNSYGVVQYLDLRTPRDPVVLAALSATSDGQSGGNGASAKAALSHDGGQIVFQSGATNLVTTAQPTGTDVLRYRALSGSLDRLSQSAFPAGGPTAGALGPAIDPAVSDDGQYAAFAASGQGLVIGLNTRGVRQIYRIGLKYPRVDLDPNTPTAELVSGTAAGLAGDGPSDGPALSRDGRYVVFSSRAVNLAQGLDGTAQIWRKDTATGALTLVSSTTGGQPANGASTEPAVTADGRFVVFSSSATNLVNGATGQQVFLKDLQSGALRAVSAGTRPRVSANGEAIVFVSGGSVVVARGNTTTIVGAGDQPTISADARFVAWRTPASQIQVSDILRGVSALVSHTSAGTPGNAASGDPALSGDGRSIAFATDARDLVDGNLAAGQIILAGNPLVDPAGTRYWYVTPGDEQSLAVERRGDRAYVASLTYDASGNSTWYAGFCTFAGLTCAGQFNYVTGGGAIADARATSSPGASFAIAFAENGTDATLTLNQARLALRAFPLGGNTTPAIPGLPEAGWWYNTDDPSGATGWFLATSTPDTNGIPGTPVAMLTGTVYDRAGLPFWAIAQGTIAGSTSFSFGAILSRYAGGAPLGQTATQPPSASPLGPIAITWTGPRTATAVMPNGQRANLARWPF